MGIVMEAIAKKKKKKPPFPPLISFFFLNKRQNQVSFVIVVFSLLPFPHKSVWVKGWLAMMLLVMGL